MKCFELIRLEDATGVSGVGRVAEGVQFENGKCALNWLTDLTSIAIYDSIDILIAIHGHNGMTKVRWALESPEVLAAYRGD